MACFVVNTHTETNGVGIWSGINIINDLAHRFWGFRLCALDFTGFFDFSDLRDTCVKNHQIRAAFVGVHHGSNYHYQEKIKLKILNKLID